MTIYDFWKKHECTPEESRELGMYLAFFMGVHLK